MGEEMIFKVKKTTKIEKVMTAYGIVTFISSFHIIINNVIIII